MQNNMNKINSIRGMHDILAKQMSMYLHIINTARQVAKSYGFDQIQTPILEATEVFKRPLGPLSDVVNKEMYTFETRGNESVTLRPEGTANIMRCF